MKFINFYAWITLLALSTSCIDPKDLDKLEDYAQRKLHSNMEEFSYLEMKSWWSQHFENQALLALTNSQVADELIKVQPVLPKNWQKQSPQQLISFLVKSHQINSTLRSLLEANEGMISNWSTCAYQKNDFLELKEKVSLHYLSGLKIPQVAETYMLGGGSGEGGLSAFFESITTSLGTLFNRDKAQEIKKKSKNIRRLFTEKIPSDEQLQVIFVNSCREVAEESKALIEAYLPLHQELALKIQNQWKNYLSVKSLVGNHLFQNKIEEISKSDPVVRELLGEVSVMDALNNLRQMRHHLISLIDHQSWKTNIDAKEEIEDFIYAYEKQLKLIPHSDSIDLRSMNEEVDELKGVLK